jgi:hypothetical protein
MTVRGSYLVLVFVVVLCVLLTLSAQTAPQKNQPNNPLQNSDAIDKAHEKLFANEPDKGTEVGRFTDSVSQGMPADSTTATGPVPRKNFIDDYIFDRIQKDGIPHSGLSTDEEFVRRIYLDAQGMLPNPEQVRGFVASRDPDKRDKLIDSLIGSEPFTEQWAWFYGDLFRLMSYSGNGRHAFQFWMKEAFRVDRPYNETVMEMLTPAAKNYTAVPQLAFMAGPMRNGGVKSRQPTDPDGAQSNVNRLDGLDETTVEIARIFLGINMDCFSCHDGAGHLESVNYYLSTRTRQDFHRQAAFLGNVRYLGIFQADVEDNVFDNDAKGYNTGDDAPFFTKSEGRQPRSPKIYEPAFLLTGERPRPGMDPRAELARMLTHHPQFARATVNLYWGRLMTVAFVEPYDGFDLNRLDPQNPPPAPWTIQPTNPELLDALAKDFVANNFSIHHLIKTIMKSRAYQLSSRFPAEWKDSYTPYYARKYIRVLRGIEMADTLAQVTGHPYAFKYGDKLVTRLKELSGVQDIPSASARSAQGTKEERNEGRSLGAIMSSFFQSNRQAAAPIGNRATTLQAILMMSSDVLSQRVVAENGNRLDTLLKSDKSNEDAIEDLYLASLSRWPTNDEKNYILEAFPFKTDRKSAVEHLAWVLLNAPEFLVNH